MNIFSNSTSVSKVRMSAEVVVLPQAGSRLRHDQYISMQDMQLEAQLKQKTVQMDNLDSTLIATKRELAQQRRDREIAEQVRHSPGKAKCEE